MQRSWWRIAAEVLIAAIVLVALAAMFTRLGPVAPALAGAARIVLHPLVLVLLLAAVLLLRRRR